MYCNIKESKANLEELLRTVTPLLLKFISEKNGFLGCTKSSYGCTHCWTEMVIVYLQVKLYFDCLTAFHIADDHVFHERM